MKIDGETKVVGLIGYPIGHTLSPAMHNRAFEYLDLNYLYLPFPVKESNLKEALRALPALSVVGVNVTLPYKERVLEYLDEVSEEAELTQAVNTILVKDSRLIGYNTDGKGFVTSLKKGAEFNPRDKKVVIIGAGGASRAVSIGLAKEGVEKITLIDIVFNKAQSLASHIAKNISKVEVAAVKEEGLGKEVREADILINATPLGMKPDDSLPIDPKLLHPNLLVYDLIYNPSKTKLLSEAERIGAKTLNGIGMLLYQGALTFTIWTGREAPIEVMARALKEELKTQVS
ncbi:shikimate dehydrogenase [bacterium]|nr:shikimate dehydrogenase [bacterium]MCG2676046.1 shikimate dehydrogenase [bacterium]